MKNLNGRNGHRNNHDPLVTWLKKHVLASEKKWQDNQKQWEENERKWTANECRWQKQQEFNDHAIALMRKAQNTSDNIIAKLDALIKYVHERLA